eukprot:TRINITY_DN48_c0_g2_i2.p1 TRINITY_DN48_c0_g2~~TRINITY_DN48_c0_g2_i2.p1  ORF type:complete len:509 (+),score=242.27 TRINITY_DN48_c0_g2_i2:77-1528(+)
MRSAAAPAATLLLLASALPCAYGGNFSLRLSNDGRRVMDLGVFGFGSAGVMELRVRHLAMADQHARGPEREKEHIGFTLDWVTTAQFARQEKNYGKGEEAQRKICFIEDPVVVPQNPPVKNWRTTFPLQEQLAKGDVRDVVFLHHVTEPGLYALFFYNCKGFSDKSTKLQLRPVSFDVRVSQFNVIGGQPRYLPIGNYMLPWMYFGFTLIFFVMAAGWVRTMQLNPEHVHKIHHVMAMLIVLKTLSLFFEAMKFSTQQTKGVPTAWDVMYYIFLTLKGIMLFLVILLSTNDKHVAMAILPLQILINIAIAVIEETSEGSKSWAYWRDTLRVLDILCCCVVLLPIIWSIKQLRSLGPAEGKVARNLSRLRQFRTFYMFVVGFIYFTRIFVVIIESNLPFRMTWVAPFVQEAAAVAFYLFTGLRFRPQADNPYLYLEVEDMDDADLREELEQAAQMRPEQEAAAASKSQLKSGLSLGGVPDRTEV